MYLAMADILAAKKKLADDHLLSVVLECNTEHQDPSRLTGQEDSDFAISQKENIRDHVSDQKKRSQDLLQISPGLQNNNYFNFYNRSGCNEHEDPQRQNIEMNQAPQGDDRDVALDLYEIQGIQLHGREAVHDDDTPQEKLRYVYREYQQDDLEDDINNGSDHAADLNDEQDPERELESDSSDYDGEEADSQAHQQPQEEGGQRQGHQQAPQEEMVDLNNYKGIYFDDENEKYQCPVTGAHFKFEDLGARLERIRTKRGDPLVEFDSRGNKVYVKSVALQNKAVSQGNSNIQRKESSNTRPQMTITADQKPIKPADKRGQTQQKPLKAKIAPQTQLNNIELLQEALNNKGAIAPQSDKQFLGDFAQEQKNGSCETVKITGSLLAEHEGATAAMQASRNQKLPRGDSDGLVADQSHHESRHNQLLQQQHQQQQEFQIKTQQQLANVFGTSAKESRNKNRIHNPQVTKNSMNSNTLDKLVGSAQKLHKQTMVQQQYGRNTNLSALINHPAQVKSHSSLLDSSSKRTADPKSKLFSGGAAAGSKKVSNQYSMTKKAQSSGFINPSDFLQHQQNLQQSASNARNKKQAALLSTGAPGNLTLSSNSNWTQSMLDSQNQNQHPSRQMNKTSGNVISNGYQQQIQKTASFRQQRQQQLSQGSTSTNKRHIQTEIFESLPRKENSEMRRLESGRAAQKGLKNKAGTHGGGSNLRNSNQVTNKMLADRGSLDMQQLRSTTNKTSKMSNTLIKKAGVAAENHYDGVNSSNMIGSALQDSQRVQKGGPRHHRKVNTLQENMQFIKDLQKTKSLKSLQQQTEAGIIYSKKVGGKTLTQTQYQNLSTKLIANNNHKKQLSKAEIAAGNLTNSKFLAGVKVSAGHNQNISAQIPQTAKASHGLYNNTGASQKSGAIDSVNSRKLIKSSSHVQIGKTGANNLAALQQHQQQLNQANAAAANGLTNGAEMGSLPGQPNPSTTLKQLHKNMSVAQLNQPHLQGSFLTSLQQHQQINGVGGTSHTQQQDSMMDNFGTGAMLSLDMTQGRRPDSKYSQNDRQTAQSLSQGKSLSGVPQKKSIGVASKTTTFNQSTVKPNLKKQQYLHQKAQISKSGNAASQGAFPVASSAFLNNNNGHQSLTQRIANSKIVAGLTNVNEAAALQQTTKKKTRKGTEMTIMATRNEETSLLQANQSKIESHRSQHHHRSNTNLVQQSSQHPLQQVSNSQMTASALLRNLNDKQMHNYQKSVSQVRSSLMTGQKDSVPAKSRNPATAQISLSQKQGGVTSMRTLPNNLNPLSATNAGDHLGIGGGSAMSLMFNQSNRIATKSRDGQQKSNQNAVTSPSHATIQRLKTQQTHSQAIQEKVSRGLYMGTTQPQKQRVKRSQQNPAPGKVSVAQPNALRKSPSLGIDKMKKNIQAASSKQSLSYGIGATHQKKQTASSENLFLQQMQAIGGQGTASPKKGEKTGTSQGSSQFQNLAMQHQQTSNGSVANLPLAGNNQNNMGQGQGTARSQRLSLQVDKNQN